MLLLGVQPADLAVLQYCCKAYKTRRYAFSVQLAMGICDAKLLAQP